MGFLLDFRYAIRNMIKSLRFSLLIIFIMVGSLTISLVGFNFVHTIAFSHSEFNNNDDIRILKVTNRLSEQREFTYEMLEGFRELEAVKNLNEWIIIKRTQFWLSTIKRSNHYRGAYVDPAFFSFLGQSPVIGRSFTNSDFENNAPNVAVISHIVWQELYQGRDDILGEQLQVNDHAYTIVGVMAKRNHFPIFSKVWLPAKKNVIKPNNGIDILYKLPTTNFEKAFERQLSQFFFNNIKDSISESTKQSGNNVLVESLTIVELNTDGEAVFVFSLFVFGIVLVLFIAGVNIGNLLFAKIMEKQKESAIRAALGASKKRVIQQHITEGLIYCGLSWVFTLLCTSIALTILNFHMNMMFKKMPYWWYWQLNTPTVMVSLLLLLIIFSFSVLLPAYKSANFNISNVLRDSTRGATGKEAILMSRRLLCIQVSLVSFLLMIASTVGYVMYSIANNIDEDMVKGVYSISLEMKEEREISNSEKLTLINTLATKLNSSKVINEAALYEQRISAEVLYPSGEIFNEKFVDISAESHLFSRKLKLGRNFNENDNTEAKPVAIISESLAIALFSSTNVLGQQLKLKDGKWSSVEIVGIAHDEISGVVGDSRHELYFSLRQILPDSNGINLRLLTNASSDEALEELYRIKMQLSQPVNLTYIFDHYYNHLSMINSIQAMIAVFLIVGGFALSLSLIGIYAMGISNINKSRYEIGIRRAIGAKDKQILLLFIRKNIKHIMYGIIISLLLFTILCYLAAELFRGNVPLTIMLQAGFFTVLAIMTSVCLALYVPVKRVVKQQPVASLKMD
ncbi:ABC transporter permease [Pseudoalteromonas sp. SSM20]|uniref:ABC transporter permease n=1 Tax=Pseudoalteromonas sp. SSM20 TaxID=3139394 RepID=UPI003BA8B0B4